MLGPGVIRRTRGGRLVIAVSTADLAFQNYEYIFKANGPPPPPKEPAPATPAAPAARQRPAKKGVTHSHYLQSKVYRALERIKAERADELAAGAVAEAAAVDGAAAAEGAAKAAEGAAEGAAKAAEGGAEAGKDGKDGKSP